MHSRPTRCACAGFFEVQFLRRRHVTHKRDSAPLVSASIPLHDTGMQMVRNIFGIAALLAVLLVWSVPSAMTAKSEPIAGMEHTSPCPPPCLDHSDMAGHAAGQSCQLCLACFAIRDAFLHEASQPVFACIGAPLLAAAPIRDALLGLDPPPPRL